MTAVEEIEACLYELRIIRALEALAVAADDGLIQPEDILTLLELESVERG